MDVAPEELAITSIRVATRQRHTTLESVLQLDPPFSHRRYLDALRGFDVFLSSWEPRIEAALPVGLHGWFASRSRHALLRKDLACLDGAAVPQAQDERECAQAVAEIDLAGAAEVFGSLYVLEGSALGGQVIAREARVSLGLGPHNGAAYFAGLDRHTAARWTSFRTLLEEQVGTERLARRKACTAACQTFDALIATFTGRCRAQAAA